MIKLIDTIILKVKMYRLITRIFEKLDFWPEINDEITTLNDYIDKHKNNIITWSL